MATQLLPVSVQMQEMMAQQQKAIEALRAQLAAKDDNAQAASALAAKQEVLEKMSAIAPAKPEPAMPPSASVEAIPSVAKASQPVVDKDSHAVINVGGEKDFTVVEKDSGIVQVGADVLKSSKQLTIVVLPMSTI